MTELELGVGGGGVAGFIALARWAVSLWATVRREELEANKLAAAARSADSARMVEALIAQARSNAELGGKIEHSNAVLSGKIEALTTKLDTLIEVRERTPVEGWPVARADDPPSDPGSRGARRARGTPKPPRDDDQ